jgi:hypothetical protein
MPINGRMKHVFYRPTALSRAVAQEARNAAKAAGIKPETLCQYATGSSTAYERLRKGRMMEPNIKHVRSYIKEWVIARGLT